MVLLELVGSEWNRIRDVNIIDLFDLCDGNNGSCQRVKNETRRRIKKFQSTRLGISTKEMHSNDF